MANSIMSDLLFGAIMYFNLASFIFIIKKRSWIALGIFTVSLFCLLHIRYSAMLFPILFSVLFFFMLKDKIRWIAIAATLFVTIVFYKQVQNSMKETVGLYQFSTGFDGWQIINNGIHVLPFINLEANDIRDPEIKAMHQFMSQHKNIISETTEGGTVPSANFMWSNDLPLQQYLYLYTEHTKELYSTSWVKLGSGPYKKYGQYLITRYPFEYMKHFFMPNTKQIFYSTHFEIIRYYGASNDKPEILKYYNLSESENMQPKNDIYNKFVIQYIQKSMSMIWLLVALVGVFAIVFRKKIVMDKSNWKVFWALFIFAALYYSSTAFAGPLVPRFWTVTGAFQLIFIYILLNQTFVFQKIKHFIKKK